MGAEGGGMKDLTERQKAVLRFVTEYQQEHGYPPTNREIAVHLSISLKSAHDHILALVEKNMIRTKKRISRSIEILKRADSQEEVFLDIPVVGDVAAGTPILAEENIDGQMQFPVSLLRKGAVYFALKVRGDSMSGAGILSGDLVLIEKKEHAENGQIVVAVINEAITLKRFFRENARIKLQAENPVYKPIYTTDARIVGVLALLLRSY
jgi:repressor LexA